MPHRCVRIWDPSGDFLFFSLLKIDQNVSGAIEPFHEIPFFGCSFQRAPKSFFFFPKTRHALGGLGAVERIGTVRCESRPSSVLLAVSFFPLFPGARPLADLSDPRAGRRKGWGGVSDPEAFAWAPCPSCSLVAFFQSSQYENFSSWGFGKFWVLCSSEICWRSASGAQFC